MKRLRSQTLYLSRVIPISALLLIVLFKFQNCGMPNEAGINPSNHDGGVRIIDQWSEQKVAFLNPLNTQDTRSSTMTSASELRLQGLCVGGTSEGMITYDFNLYDAGEKLVHRFSGQVECKMGNFEIVLPELSFGSCSDHYDVRAVLDGNENDLPAITKIVPICS
jgi:hypothetical protein